MRTMQSHENGTNMQKEKDGSPKKIPVGKGGKLVWCSEPYEPNTGYMLDLVGREKEIRLITAAWIPGKCTPPLSPLLVGAPNANNHLNVFQNKKAHENLVFDDEPVTSLLYGCESAAPAPANILELWQTDNSGVLAFDALISVKELIVLLETLGKQQEAAAIRNLRDMDRLFAEGNQNSLLTLRNFAYDLFERRDFHQAGHIYRRLLEKRFEVPGTFSHLARTLLAMPGVDNRKEAGDILKKAWEKRRDAPPLRFAANPVMENDAQHARRQGQHGYDRNAELCLSERERLSGL